MTGAGRESGGPGAGVVAPTAAASVLRTLRGMGDGLLTLDEGWRITFANEEAERLLGDGRTLLGSILWDLPASRVPPLEAQSRRAASEGRPIGFDLDWPAD